MKLKKKSAKVAARVSIAFSKKDWAIVEKSMKVCFRIGEYKIESCIVMRQRSEHIRRFLTAACLAVIRAGCCPMPLAMDARHETKEERAERLGEAKPPGVKVLSNIIVLAERIKWHAE